MKKGDIVRLKIDDLAFGGEGVARIDTEQGKLVVFVEGVVHGDEVLARIFSVKRNLIKAKSVSIINKSPSRCMARCKHFGSEILADGTVGDTLDPARNCGGCVWQFLEYAQQLAVKEKIVKDAFLKIARVNEDTLKACMSPIQGMRNPWYYRNKMEFSFSKDENGRRTLGLHLKNRHHDVTEITECHLFRPWVGELLKAMRLFFETLQIQGDLTALTVRCGSNTGEILVNLALENSEKDFSNDFLKATQEFFAQHDTADDKLVSVSITNFINRKGFPKRREERILFGQGSFTEILHLHKDKQLRFRVASDAFIQPNTQQAEYIYTKVAELAELKAGQSAFDLYAGTGTIALTLALSGASVTAIELNANAVSNGKANAAENHIENVVFECGDVAKILPNIKRIPDVTVLDPPRAGLAASVIENIVASGTKKLIYVSCNPSTLARDVALFVKGGYVIKFLQAVDQFCHTWHVESIVLLQKS